MENNTNQLNSMLCKKNCGFFGNPSCDGYCSKCYKDHVKRQNSGSANGRVTPTDVINTSSQPQPVANIASNINQTAGSQTNPIASITSANNTSAPIPIPSRANSITTKTEDSDVTMMSIPSQSTLNSSTVTPSVAIASSCTSEASGSLTGTSLTSSSIGSEKNKRNRCCFDTCKRKVGLTGFDCRCGGLYCWEHRYSDKHDCKFDYKELGQDQIRKNNPIVVGEKIQKI